MCYTIEKNLTREQLEKRFQGEFKPNRPYSPGKRVSAFTLPEVPVILQSERSKIDLLTWGLIPFWAKDAEVANNMRTMTFNAKAETLTKKTSFRHTIARQRCLVLTNGFYEWQHRGKLKAPYFISLKNDIAMPMAGLSDSWTNQETGEVINSFTIVTTAANPLMEQIHNTKKRMPVIFFPEQEELWLDNHTDSEQALLLLKQFPEEEMLATEIQTESSNKETQIRLFD